MKKWRERESEKAWTGKSTENRLTEKWRVYRRSRFPAKRDRKKLRTTYQKLWPRGLRG